MFKIVDFVSFDEHGRAYCPSCTAAKGRQPSQKSLALVPETDGAYICHAGCEPDQIRAALDAPPPAKTTAKSRKPGAAKSVPDTVSGIAGGEGSSGKKESKAKTYSAQKVADLAASFHPSTNPIETECHEWLMARGLEWQAINHFQLSFIDMPNFKGIRIPIPVPDQPDHHFFKTRCYPFDKEPNWSQKGIPASVFWTHRGEGAVITLLCEGEWDAMLLGWKMSKSAVAQHYDVACFTCGAGNVPPDEMLSQLRGEVRIYYDRDPAGEKGAKLVASRLLTNCVIAQVPGPEDCPEGWDISDALNNHISLQDILAAGREASKQGVPKLESPDPVPAVVPGEYDDFQERAKAGKIIDRIRMVVENRIRLNSLTKRVELDGDPLRVEDYYLHLADGYNIGAGKDLVADTLVWLAREAEYSPVVEYLDQCHSTYGGGGMQLLETLAARYFGTDDPLHQVYVTKTLLAAVARAYQPGCKVDTALILKGSQGLGKSTFFKIMGGAWFNDSLGSASDKDERMKLHSSWICEWAELEAIFRKRDLAETKAFLSCQTDSLRVPYGRSVEEFARPSIIVGSTNEDEFLADPTGSRRFWILPVEAPLDREQLATERDQIWAAAVHLYKSGQEWWLNEKEAALNQARNETYQTEDPWEEKILDFIGDATEITIPDILTQCLQAEAHSQSRSDQMRVAGILKQRGFRKHRSNGRTNWIFRGRGGTGSTGSTMPLTQQVISSATKSYLDIGSTVSPEPEKGSATYPSHLEEEVALPQTRSQQGIVLPVPLVPPFPIEGKLENSAAASRHIPQPGQIVWYRQVGTGRKVKGTVIPVPADWLNPPSDGGVFVKDPQGDPLFVELGRISEPGSLRSVSNGGAHA